MLDAQKESADGVADIRTRLDRFLVLRTEALWAGKVRWPEAFVVGLLVLGFMWFRAGEERYARD